jgi:histidine triad (HIT) family protein
MEDCIFCKIIRKELATSLLHEDERAVAFRDIQPKAPVHLLIVPREHIASVTELRPEQAAVVGHLILVAQKLAREQNLPGYKLVFNVGREGGQVVEHLHLHLIGGWDSPGGQSQLTRADL